MLDVEIEVTVERIDVNQTRNGNRRYVLRAEDGKEYTTFRQQIGDEAAKYEGRRARITFHEDQRNGFTNVYLDAIAPVADQADNQTDNQADGDGSLDPQEAAWQTAVEAAPWLIGESQPEHPVDPDQLFERLKPFQERVEEDIREDQSDD